MAFVNLMSVLYPVGSIYMSISSTSPSSLIGGTWSEVTGGVIAASGNGFASAGSYGGSLTMTVAQMPSHTHQADSSNPNLHYGLYKIQSGRCGKLTCSAGISGGSTRYIYASNTGYEDLADVDHVGYMGDGDAYYPRHYSLHIWRRTA